MFPDCRGNVHRGYHSKHGSKMSYGETIVSGGMPQPAPIKVPWTYEVDGNDLVVRNIIATCFGGAFDSGDNGQTESGFNNSGDGSSQANTFQCALPIRSTEKATACSPLAFNGKHIPWLTKVKVWHGNDESTAIECFLTDNGPDVLQYPTHALDLNPPAALHFEPSIPIQKIANVWSGDNFSYRIIGGAKYIS